MGDEVVTSFFLEMADETQARVRVIGQLSQLPALVAVGTNRT